MMPGDTSKQELRNEPDPEGQATNEEVVSTEDGMYALSKARHTAEVSKQIAKLRKKGLRHRAKASGYLVKAKKSDEKAATLLHKANKLRQESASILEKAKTKGKGAVEFQKKLDSTNAASQGSDTEMQMSKLEHEEAKLTRQANQMQARAASMAERASKMKRKSVDFMQKQRAHEIESACGVKMAEQLDRMKSCAGCLYNRFDLFSNAYLYSHVTRHSCLKSHGSGLLEAGEISVDEIEQKRDLLNIEAEKHRRNRDELNERTRQFADQRDRLNSEVRKLIEEAGNHKRRRDELNEKVREAKDQREIWNKAYTDKAAELVELRRSITPKTGAPPSKLKRDLKSLEFKQMTTVLTPDKEKEIVEQMSKLQQEIRKREDSLKSNKQYSELLKNVNEAKEKAEGFHKLVSELAESAQKEHDAMMDLYDNADRIRKDADEAQAKFVESKLLADEEHKKHIDAIHQVHDFDKLLYGIRQKQRRPRGAEDAEKVAKDAEEVFEKFKKGEKLSTEDLMLLQKSGYL